MLIRDLEYLEETTQSVTGGNGSGSEFGDGGPGPDDIQNNVQLGSGNVVTQIQINTFISISPTINVNVNV